MDQRRGHLGGPRGSVFARRCVLPQSASEVERSKPGSADRTSSRTTGTSAAASGLS
jgi:hypothetical protein